MNINGVPVYVDINLGRRNGKRKLFKALNTLADQDFDSVENCIALINGIANATEVDYEMDEEDNQ